MNCTGSGRARSNHQRSTGFWAAPRSEEHTSEFQSLAYLVCRLLLEKKKTITRALTPRDPTLPFCYNLYHHGFSIFCNHATCLPDRLECCYGCVHGAVLVSPLHY